MKPDTLIETDTDLAHLVSLAEQRGAVALDTEFVWERTYFPRLGLIQLGLSNEECYLIDPLATTNLQPLGRLLTNGKVVKIFHDAPQDLAILARATNSVPANIFDTRLAAGFAELPATLSLGSLTENLLDIKLDKSSTRTNWLHRPLSEKQVLYALDDVRYLRALRVILLSRITEPRVKEWLYEELAQLNNPQTYNFFNSEERYKRVKGYHCLNSTGLAVLKKLSLWREETAKQKDRPRGHIIPDGVLLEIARNSPRNAEELKTKSGISDKAIKRYEEKILKLIREGERTPAPSHPRQRRRKPTKKESNLLLSLSKYIRLKSDFLGIDQSLIGNNSELKEMAHRACSGGAPQDTRQNRGWRKQFLEEFFEEDWSGKGKN